MTRICFAFFLCIGCGSQRPSASPDGGSDGGSDGGTTEPPVICRTPSDDGGAWFTEVTDEIGFAVTPDREPLATGVVAGDLDGDGYQDLLAFLFPAQRDNRGWRYVFMNRPDPSEPSKRVFVDETEASGILATRAGAGVRGISIPSLGDLDSDGDVDLVGCPGSGEIGSVLDPCDAFLNDGSGRFTLAPSSDLDAEVFWVPSSVMLDYDEDGILDFWPGTVGSWPYGPAITSRPRLYRGNGDGTFADVSSAVGLPSNPTEGGNMRINFGVTSCDLEGDGDRDVLMANYFMQPNNVWRNDGGTFVDIASELGAARTGAAGGHTFSITCADLEDDGDHDLAFSTVSHPGSGTDKSALLLNPGSLAAFTRADAVAMGFARGEDWMEGDNTTVFVDVDLDGRKDLFTASSNYPQQWAEDTGWTHAWLWRQTDTLAFEDMTGRTPFGDTAHQSLEGPAWVDFDADGDLDLVIGTGAFNGEFLGLRNTLRAYRNDVGHRSNWTQLRLEGSGPGGANRSAIGARVTIVAGGRTQHQEVMGSWGHSNTQNDVLTFGLGDACAIDRIEIVWPDRDDTTTVIENVRANYPIAIRQGESTVRYTTR